MSSGGAPCLTLAKQTAERPCVRLPTELEGSRDVEEHPLREEPVDLLVGCAALPLHRRVQGGEFLPDDAAAVLVAASRVRLELDAEQVAVRQELHVRETHQVEDRALLIVVRLSSGSLVEDEAGSLEPVPDHGKEQFPLRTEQLEQVRLRHADGPCDRLRRCPAVPTLRKLAEGSDDDRVAPFVGGLALARRRSSRVHGRNLVSTK